MSQSDKTIKQLPKFIRLLSYSYLQSDDLLFKIALTCKEERHLIKSSRLLTEKSVKIVIKQSCISLPTPSYLMEFADKLTIQSLSMFSERNEILNYIMQCTPERLNENRMKLMLNEISQEVITTIIKREIKFQDLFLYHINTEYTDKIDSLLKSTTNLKIYNSNFRQIFPRSMTNTVKNSITNLHLENVEFNVRSSIFDNDQIDAIFIKESKLRVGALNEIKSDTIKSLVIDHNTIWSHEILQNLVDLISRQMNLERLSISDTKISIQQLKMIVENMPATKKFCFSAKQSYYLDDLLELGLIDKSQEAFIGCKIKQKEISRVNGSVTSSPFSNMKSNNRDDLNSFANSYRNIEIEQISKYVKIVVDDHRSENELRIVCKK